MSNTAKKESSLAVEDSNIQYIPQEYFGLRVDQALAKIFPEYSRAQLTTWLKAGNITMNDKLCKPKEKVCGQEKIRFDKPKEIHISSERKPSTASLPIIYEDDDCLIINKPAGLTVHPGAGQANDTLMDLLIDYRAEQANLPRAGIVHRLDKDTTGLLIVAKSDIAHTALIRQMQARDIHRQYLAVVAGHFISGGTITTGFGRDPRNRIKMAVTQFGKEAITHYTIAQKLAGTTLLNVELETGRTHQIRVHMAHIKHPIVGDPIYHPRKSYAGLTPEQLGFVQQFKRQALHAYRLQLMHPILETPLEFFAPIPDDLQQLIQVLTNECHTS